MYHHRLVIAYKGTHYFGWQDLGANEQKPTVQASIQQALEKICKYQRCTVSAASRTDAGVHAQGQVAKITIPLAIESGKLQLGLNSLLADDIRILQCTACAPTFNAGKDSTSKEYHYYFCTDAIHNPVLGDTVAHIRTSGNHGATNSLDIELMQRGCALFIGEHDFYSFAKRDASTSSTIRTVLSCSIQPVESLAFSAKVYCLKVVGKGFLKHMIRYIAGALFALGKHQLSLNCITDALATHKQEKISPSAKSRGLHLMKITYEGSNTHT